MSLYDKELVNDVVNHHKLILLIKVMVGHNVRHVQVDQ